MRMITDNCIITGKLNNDKDGQRELRKSLGFSFTFEQINVKKNGKMQEKILRVNFRRKICTCRNVKMKI